VGYPGIAGEDIRFAPPLGHQADDELNGESRPGNDGLSGKHFRAQQSVARANDQYVSSLYQHNIAKLSLARALGVAQKNYKSYVGGK